MGAFDPNIILIQIEGMLYDTVLWFADLSRIMKTRKNPDVPHCPTGSSPSVVGIFCNVLLFGVKMTIGTLMRSMAVMADAFNNLSDAASSVIGFVGVKMANKPADKDHPFGHGRMEYIAALIVSFLVIEVGITFFKSSIEKIRNPEELAFSWISFIILLALSVGVKLWLSVFNRVLGRRIDSKVHAGHGGGFPWEM